MKENRIQFPYGEIPEEWYRSEIKQLIEMGYDIENGDVGYNVIELFEKIISEYVGSKYGIAISSATNGLFLTLLYLKNIGEIKDGDEITIPARTFVSVPMTIKNLGLNVKFRHIDWREEYQLKPTNVITGHGSEIIISTIMRTFLHDEDTALTSTGTFMTFRIQVKSRGIGLTEVPLKKYRYDLQAIADHITDKTKIIYLANPNNPTGNIFTDDEFRQFMEQVPTRILVLLDEAYFEFAADYPDYPDSMKYRFDNVISLRTFSKAYGLAGVRIGYGFAHENLIKNLMKIKLPFEPSSPAQAAALAALDDHEFLSQSIEIARSGREFFYDFFSAIGVSFLESFANFVTIILESENQVNQIYDRLLKQGIIVRPLKSFGLPDCIRITTGLAEENSIFAENFGQIFKSI